MADSSDGEITLGREYFGDVDRLRAWLLARSGQTIAGRPLVASSGGVLQARADRVEVVIGTEAGSMSGQAAVVRGTFNNKAVAVRAEVRTGPGTLNEDLRIIKMQLSDYVLSEPKLMEGQLPFLTTFLCEERLTSDADSAAIVIDVLEWGTPLDRALNDSWLAAASLREKVVAALPMLESMASLFESGRYIHRDINPENLIFCDDGLIRVNDWGIVRQLEQGVRYVRTRPIGKQGICFPPEMLNIRLGEDERAKAGVWTDAWSLGCVLTELFTGSPVHEQRQGSRYILPYKADRLPDPVRNVLKGMVKVDFERRMTARQAHDQLQKWLEIVPRPPREIPWKRLAVAAAAVLTVGGVAFGATQWDGAAWNGSESNNTATDKPGTTGSPTPAESASPETEPTDGAEPRGDASSGSPKPGPTDSAVTEQQAALLQGWGEQTSTTLTTPVGRTSRAVYRWRGNTLTVTVALRSLPTTATATKYARTCRSPTKAKKVAAGVYLVVRGRTTADIRNIEAAAPWHTDKSAEKETQSLLRPAACTIYLRGDDLKIATPPVVRTKAGKAWTAGTKPVRYTFTIPRAGMAHSADASYPRLVAGLVLVPAKGPTLVALTPSDRKQS